MYGAVRNTLTRRGFIGAVIGWDPQRPDPADPLCGECLAMYGALYGAVRRALMKFGVLITFAGDRHGKTVARKKPGAGAGFTEN